MKIAAIIPARKGSKRIPKKNHLKFMGDHIIRKVIQNIQQSSHDIDIFISTDDEALIDLVKDLKINILQRDNSFCDDYSTVVDLIRWHYENDLKEYDLIYQTFCHSVCIDSETIDRSLSKITNSTKKFLMSIAKLDGPVEWTFKIDQGKLKPNFLNKQNIRSQELPSSYIDAGQFYIYKSEWFESDESNSYELSDWISLKSFQSNDLDEEEDIEKLEINYKLSKSIFKNLA
tara:strand:- start:5046 stop:5738 length:693 start_codon:yes stop_codon:yes gene_type:complete